MPAYRRQKNVLLGVSGGIAAYKACEIITKLKLKCATVRVVVSENGLKFIPAVTLSSLTEHPVYSDLWNEAENGEIDHIEVSQKWAHVFVVAPATANAIGKFANGIADDYLSTMYMAASCPKVIAPAMNTVMLNSKAVARNIATLVQDGVEIIEPATGRLACGTYGDGKLAPVDEIVEKVLKWLT